MTYSSAGGALTLLFALVLLAGPALSVGLCAWRPGLATALLGTGCVMLTFIIALGAPLLLFYGKARLPGGLESLFREAGQGVGVVLDGGRILLVEGVAMVAAGAIVGLGLWLFAVLSYIGHRTRRGHFAMDDL